ncbi:hypothetical protein [Amycolatopsis sp. lyj-112]|uniref:hypothetical protein n=1 Tax=Amycolatopsis sp. lyj-112 TaxID=2789288 RepID=UPI00397A3952
MDERLIGLWSESTLYPNDVESAELAFRWNGSGWLYWSSWSTSFSVSRYTWSAFTPGTLVLKFHCELDGTWSIEDGVVRHDVESEEERGSLVKVGYEVVPGEDPLGNTLTVLSLDRPLHDHLAGSRFAWVEQSGPLSDPAAGAPRPGPPSHR